MVSLSGLDPEELGTLDNLRWRRIRDQYGAGPEELPVRRLALQRDFSENVTIGAEVYSQGAQFVGDKATTFYNAGSYITLTKNFGILFSLGHSFSGDDESVAYFALGFTGPFGKSAALLDAAAPRPEGAGFGR